MIELDDGNMQVFIDNVNIDHQFTEGRMWDIPENCYPAEEEFNATFEITDVKVYCEALDNLRMACFLSIPVTKELEDKLDEVIQDHLYKDMD